MLSFSSLSRAFVAAVFVLTAAVVSKAQSPQPDRTEIANAAQPQLVVGSGRQVWLAYGRSIPAPVAVPPASGGAHAGHGAPRAAGEIFVARSDDGGATFAPAIKVATVPNLMLGMRRGPRLAVHGDRITVTAIGAELLAFTSGDAGRTWSEALTINDVPTSAREGLHDLAGAPDGRLFVTWLDLRNATMELWGATSIDGGRTWAPDAPVYKSSDKTICECCHPTALYDAAGNLAVMWRNAIDGSRDMWLTTRAKDTMQFSAARKLGEGTWQLKACPMDGGRIVALGEGKFGAVWQRAGNVFFSGETGREIDLGAGKQPVAISADNSVRVIWQRDTDLVSARVLRDARIEAPIKIATGARFASVAVAAGRTLLAYESGPPKGATTVVVERLSAETR